MSLHEHRYFCGPNAVRTAGQALQQRKRPRKGGIKTGKSDKSAKVDDVGGPSNPKTRKRAPAEGKGKEVCGFLSVLKLLKIKALYAERSMRNL